MKANEETSNHFALLLFNLIGFFSTISLFFILLYVVASFFQGDLELWKNFIEAYPGSQPFLIFIFPVLLIASPAWIFTLFFKRHKS